MAEEGDGHSDSGSDGPPSRTNGQAKVGHVMGLSGWSRDGSRGWDHVMGHVAGHVMQGHVDGHVMGHVIGHVVGHVLATC